ncbi:MAG: hypothetical protein IIB94_12730 [Candidatus Marinimicrobia bacterium]|nr:hypothetical protein [Candidatus Neomarinimicrobiota bacterium]
MRYLKFIIPSIVLLLGCGDGLQEPEETMPTLALSPDTLSIMLGQEGDLALQIEDFDVSIFGISMRIAYDSSNVSFNKSTGFASGDFFGSNIVAFVEDEPPLIYLTVTLQQGQQEVSGTGELGKLTFIGKSPGSGTIEIISSELIFFDSDGNEVIIPGLEIEIATVTAKHG